VHVHCTGDDVEGADFEIGDFAVDHYVDWARHIELDATHGSARC
jgi:hypothetical protein